MYKIKRFSIRPYAVKLIKDSAELISKSPSDKYKILGRLSKAGKKYEASSMKVTSLNPVKLIKNSKDASDSHRAILATLGKLNIR